MKKVILAGTIGLLIIAAVLASRFVFTNSSGSPHEQGPTAPAALENATIGVAEDVSPSSPIGAQNPPGGNTGNTVPAPEPERLPAAPPKGQ